eukprot:TRINITY_DN12559_c0_g1_i3.p1 TRINITY_DN12559_c0_g1~~TRINITY_DN12559_c0_g1_i3.p1  ORF type:complete len:148 (-),score=31.94 TRINITY_DN12559_c0_g1_i3:8-451(-)
MAPFSWFMSKFSSEKKRHLVYFPVITLGLFWLLFSALVSVMPADAQYVTYFFYSAHRICWYGVQNQTVPAIYGNSPEAYTIFGFVNGLAGIVSFGTVLIDEVVKQVFGVYWAVDLILGGASMISLFALSSALKTHSTNSLKLNPLVQ